jgi:S-adenosylmethionine/arginine decarboxylase-like enzyme
MIDIVKEHLFYDGYDLDNNILKDIEYIEEFLKEINSKVFNNIGKINLIPYFDGKVEKDGGISGVIIGKEFHFTCHTFSFKNTVFIDYYGIGFKDEIFNLITKYFKTDNYDMCDTNVLGNFGKHLIIGATSVNVTSAQEKIDQIINNINMTPISDFMIDIEDENNYDVIKLIAESHISFHQHNNSLIIDVFSCKPFEVNKVLELLPDYTDVRIVGRGALFK